MKLLAPHSRKLVQMSDIACYFLTKNCNDTAKFLKSAQIKQFHYAFVLHTEITKYLTT